MPCDREQSLDGDQPVLHAARRGVAEEVPRCPHLHPNTPSAKGLHLRNGAHQRWEVAAAKATNTYCNAQDMCTDALTLLFETAAEITCKLTTATTTTTAAFASAQLQAWGPCLLAFLLFALTVWDIHKAHVATDGILLTWMIKVAVFLRPRLMTTLHCLLMLLFEVVGFVLVHEMGYLVVPTILLLHWRASLYLPLLYLEYAGVLAVYLGPWRGREGEQDECRCGELFLPMVHGGVEASPDPSFWALGISLLAISCF